MEGQNKDNKNKDGFDLSKLKEEIEEVVEKKKRLDSWEKNKRSWSEETQLKSGKLKKVLEQLKKRGLYEGQIEKIEIIEEKKGKYRKPKEPLPDEIQEYLNKMAINLYSHQADAIDSIRKGKNVIITTPTASGKSLAYNIPVFETLMRNKRACALYLYPLKALTNDQKKIIKDMEIELDLDVKPNTYDGDTPREIRRYLRENSRIILSNPYGFHEYLQQHYLWKSFFENLKYLIIDEAHFYRGVLGSNIAYLIRRILRICNYYHSDPQIILSSATIANPEEFSEKLTGKSFNEFELILEDGAKSGKKFFILWNPPLKDHKKNTRHSFFWESVHLITEFVKNDLQTLCFTPSHKLSEEIARSVRKNLENISPDKVDRVKSYRGGYLPGQRREIERKLRNREVLGVVSTNALELGIDIGSLDCVVLAGYPGTMISTWQRAGRAGRRNRESLIVLVANQHPLDQYFMMHPKKFFSASQEHAVIDLENKKIIKGHLLCASAELVLVKEDIQYFPKYFNEMLMELEQEKLIKRDSDGWFYNGPENTRSSKLHSLNDTGEPVLVMWEGKILESVSITKTYQVLHPGAVFLHLGEEYVVEDFSPENSIVKARKEDVDYFTESLDRSQVRILTAFKEKEFGKHISIHLGVGKVKVERDYWGYLIKKGYEITELRKLDLPKLEYETVGMWITLPTKIKDVLEKQNLNFKMGLLAILCAMVALAPMYSMCEKWDIGGSVTEYHKDTEAPTVFIFDAHEGGSGVSEKLYQIAEGLLKATYSLIRGCNCVKGCPACIYVHHCGRKRVELEKKDALEILRIMTQLLEDGVITLTKAPQASLKTASLMKWLEEGMKLENYDEKYEYFENGLKLKKIYHPYALVGMGNLQRMNADYEDAIESYNKALEIDPEFILAWNALGILYEVREDFESALKMYEEAIKRGSEEAEKNYRKILRKRKIAFQDREIDELIKEEKSFDLVGTLSDIKTTLNSVHGNVTFMRREFEKFLSIFQDVKNRQADTEEKLEKKIDLLQEILDKNEKEWKLVIGDEIGRYTKIVRELIPKWEKLEPLSQEKLINAEGLFSELQKNKNLDFSPVVLQFCISLENELAKKILTKFTFLIYEKYYSKKILKDLLKNDLGIDPEGKLRKTSSFAKSLLSLKRIKPAEIRYSFGTIIYLLNLLYNERVLSSSRLLSEFKKFLISNFKHVFSKTLIKNLFKIKDSFRNKSAHPTKITFQEAKDCRVAVIATINEFLDYVL